MTIIAMWLSQMNHNAGNECWEIKLSCDETQSYYNDSGERQQPSLQLQDAHPNNSGREKIMTT